MAKAQLSYKNLFEKDLNIYRNAIKNATPPELVNSLEDILSKGDLGDAFVFGSPERNKDSDLDIVVVLRKENDRYKNEIVEKLHELEKEYENKNIRFWISFDKESYLNFEEKADHIPVKRAADNSLETWGNICRSILRYKIATTGVRLVGDDLPSRLFVATNPRSVGVSEGYEAYLLGTRYLADWAGSGSPNSFAKAVLYASYSLVINGEEGLQKSFEDVAKAAERVMGYFIGNIALNTQEKDRYLREVINIALNAKKGELTDLSAVNKQAVRDFFRYVRKVNKSLLFEKGVKISYNKKEEIKKYIQNTLDDVVSSLEKELNESKISDTFSILFLNEFLTFLWRDLYLNQKDKVDNKLISSLEKIYNVIYEGTTDNGVIKLDMENKIVKGKFEFLLGKYESAEKTLVNTISDKATLNTDEESILDEDPIIDLDILSAYEMYSLLLFNRDKQKAIEFYKSKVIPVEPLDITAWEILQGMVKGINPEESRDIERIINSLEQPEELLELSMYVPKSDIIKLFFDKFRAKLAYIILSDVNTKLTAIEDMRENLLTKLDYLISNENYLANHRYLLQQATDGDLRLEIGNKLIETQLHYLELLKMSKDAPFMLYSIMDKYFKVRDGIIKKERYLGYRFSKVTHEDMNHRDIDVIKEKSIQELIEDGYFNYAIKNYSNKEDKDKLDRAKDELNRIIQNGIKMRSKIITLGEKYNSYRDKAKKMEQSLLGDGEVVTN